MFFVQSPNINFVRTQLCFLRLDKKKSAPAAGFVRLTANGAPAGDIGGLLDDLGL